MNTSMIGDPKEWETFQEDWRKQCEHYGENFDEYSASALQIISDFFEHGIQSSSADGEHSVLGIADGENTYHCVCLLNHTPQKGYPGKVLRVRHMTLSPYYDFEDLSEDAYADTLTDFILALLDVSKTKAADTLKIHLRSPLEARFLGQLASVLEKAKVIRGTKRSGMWLDINP
ncbi:MAG: hypothetical protein AAGE76_00205 [Pseudomonadota bacterium]